MIRLLLIIGIVVLGLITIFAIFGLVDLSDAQSLVLEFTGLFLVMAIMAFFISSVAKNNQKKSNRKNIKKSGPQV